MPVSHLDHFAVHTRDAGATAEFYSFALGLERGPRPDFTVAGVWLYCGNHPLVHIVETPREPGPDGLLDHVAFSGTGLPEFVSKLESHGIAYDLRRFPDGSSYGGAWQLFFRDPNGVRIEVDFPGNEQWPVVVDANIS
jgi:catechol 2,3-dioxygenase-like lactoylglutathione lyase family enzyme